MVGTSPFIGAGQFGDRALAYLRAFYGRPWRIAEVLEAALNSGAEAIQALPEWYVVKAIVEVKLRNPSVRVWASLPPRRGVQEALHQFARVDAEAVAIHGAIMDSLDQAVVEAQVDLARSQGFKVGAALHTPYRSLSWLQRSKVKVDFLMIPFNKLGLYMDAKASEIHGLALKLNKPVIAMKVLAAGLLPVREALEFVFSFDPPPSIAIGVASVEEAANTFKEASAIFRELTR